MKTRLPNNIDFPDLKALNSHRKGRNLSLLHGRNIQIGSFVRNPSHSLFKYTNSNILSDLNFSSLKRFHDRALSSQSSINSELSCFTMRENEATNQRIERLIFLEHNDKNRVQERKVLGQNCDEMIKRTRKEIKNISSKLRTVVSDREHRFELPFVSYEKKSLVKDHQINNSNLSSENEEEQKENRKQAKIMEDLRKRVINEPAGDHIITQALVILISIRRIKKDASCWSKIRTQNIKEKKVTFTERSKRYKRQKQLLIMEHMKKSKMYLQRWEVMKEKHKAQLQVMKRINHETQFKKIWIIFTHQYKIIKLVYDKIYEVKQEKIHK